MYLKEFVPCVYVFFTLFVIGYCQQWNFGWGWVLPYPYGCQERAVQAMCRFRPNINLPASNIRGTVIFTQRITCYRHYALQMKLMITGMPVDGNWSYHGFHVHQSRDMSRGCDSMGPHYNPMRTNHGGPMSAIYSRHVGDFGNFVKDPFGNIQGGLFDNLASLRGRYSIVGRGIVLHAKQDDLGQFNTTESKTTGNSGQRLACCVIMPL